MRTTTAIRQNPAHRGRAAPRDALALMRPMPPPTEITSAATPSTADARFRRLFKVSPCRLSVATPASQAISSRLSAIAIPLASLRTTPSMTSESSAVHDHRNQFGLRVRGGHFLPGDALTCPKSYPKLAVAVKRPVGESAEAL